MKKLISICAVLATLAAMSFAEEDRAKELDRVKAAGNVLTEIMGAPDKGIPAEVMASADCIAVIPSMLKGGFVFGGRYGKGVATCHRGDSWSAPAPIRIEGGSWGLQIGGQAVDLVMLVMNQKGMDQLLQSKFKVGADVSAAAGPVGRHAEATTDWKMRAEVLTYSRARGAFAGITLNGAVLKQDEDDTRALYGKMIPFSQILSGKVAAPEGTQPFLAQVAKYYRQSRTEQAAGKTTKPETSASTGGAAGTAANTTTSRTSDQATTGSVASGASEPSSAGSSAGTTSTTEMSSADVKNGIQKALRDQPGFSSGNVNVTVTQSTVELSGTVPTEDEKQTARRIAEQNAAGRKVVDTDLSVK